MLPFRHRRQIAELSLRVANAALEQKVERTGATRAAAEAAEVDVSFEVQQLEHQEAAANEIESQKNAHSTGLQEIEEAEASWTGQRLQLSKTRVRAWRSMAFRWS